MLYLCTRNDTSQRPQNFYNSSIAMARKDIFNILLCILLSACGNKAGDGQRQGDVGDTIPMKYAEHLTMVRYADRVEVTLKDPWHEGRVMRTYEHRKPLSRCVVFNTAHASLLQMLGAADVIRGVADLKYMNLPEIHSRVGKDITDCGDSMTPDIEKIVEMKADAVWLSPFENSGGYGRLETLGIPLIECADYMETSALGRAEWMKFYGLLVGKEREADSLFAVVESRYLKLKRQAQKSKVHRSVLTERLTGGTWYVPGGRSSMGRLLQDAGGHYPWAKDNHSGSLPLSFETVLDRAGDADVWVFNYIGTRPLDYRLLEAEYHGYAQLKAFRTRQVYYVNSLQVPYFEEVSFRPDWLLADYVELCCQDSIMSSKLRYLTRVKEQ